ncbi:hypothetical protein [Duganella levis]|uniref:Uncharacterized protein n=1 Tax=Duganella levis TaxID=2692169 RepID=A0ABW9W6H0_9BURK|nr:hypothetical protein [Duganella levis]MYN29210.1 hypothetical protein [Duganella levis]
MFTDPDLRNVSDLTTGDFIAFELFDADVWRAFRISRTALDVLSNGRDLPPLQSFEQNFDRIKGVAFNAHKVGNGYVVLDSDSFK